MDQLTAVRHRLLHSQYLEIEQRTQFPVELLQQMAEERGFDLAAVEQHIHATMKVVADEFLRQSEQRIFSGGNAGGGKAFNLRHRYTAAAELRAEQRGIVLTCVA